MVQKRVLLRHFMLKVIVLPRQAREKHKGKLKKDAFLQAVYNYTFSAGVSPWVPHSSATAPVAVAVAATKSDDESIWFPSPPTPLWRNDTENIRVTAALNRYLSKTLFKTESGYEGPTTDARPISLEWKIAGEKRFFF